MDSFCDFPPATDWDGDNWDWGGVMKLFCLGHMTYEVPFSHLYHSEFNQRNSVGILQ